jgi:hypothetical protein
MRDDQLHQSSQDVGGPNQSRRNFLGQVSTLAAGVAALEAAGNPSEANARSSSQTLPTVPLGSHRITRLILGGNPVYGHSHFNSLYSQHLRDYHTPERVVTLLQRCREVGITTWQNSYAPRTVEDVQRCRDQGIEFQWLLLGKPGWERDPAVVDEAARLKPLGIAPHGQTAERLHRDGKLSVLRDLLKRIRDAGVLVGLSCHNPQVVEIAEEQAWDVDYYMCCAYYMTRPRDEFASLLGQVPLGELYIESDRQRMFGVIRAARRPCLVFKVLAAGRANLSSAGIRKTFKETLDAIKPSDAMIIGMFQEFGDQVGMNADVVRALSAAS